MPSVRVPYAAIHQGTLPEVCVICGERADHLRFDKVRPVSMAWGLGFPLLGLFLFWTTVFKTPAPSVPPAGLPFCDKHLDYWPRRARIIVIIAGAMALWAIPAIVLISRSSGAEGRQSHGVLDSILGGGCCLIVFTLPILMLLHLRSFRPASDTRDSITFAAAHRNFRDAVNRLFPADR